MPWPPGGPPGGPGPRFDNQGPIIQLGCLYNEHYSLTAPPARLSTLFLLFWTFVRILRVNVAVAFMQSGPADDQTKSQAAWTRYSRAWDPQDPRNKMIIVFINLISGLVLFFIFLQYHGKMRTYWKWGRTSLPRRFSGQSKHAQLFMSSGVQECKLTFISQSQDACVVVPTYIIIIPFFCPLWFLLAVQSVWTSYEPANNQSEPANSRSEPANWTS